MSETAVRRWPRSRTAAATVLAGLALATAGCAANAGSTDMPQQPGAPATQTEQTLTVFAAASLTDVMTTIADDFERTHPGVTVRTSLAGSSTLVAQLADGADADVLATADDATMQSAIDEGLVDGDPTPFATNELQIAVAPGNPLGIAGLADLDAATSEARLVVCAPQVPCGAASVALAEHLGVRLAPVSETTSVTDVVEAVRSGQADAGLVYVTDVRANEGELEGVPIAEASVATTTLSVATLADAESPGLAGELLAALTSAEGRAVLDDAGFGAP